MHSVIIDATIMGHTPVYTCNYVAVPYPRLRPARRDDGGRIGQQRWTAIRQIAGFRRTTKHSTE